ncbi:MAG TPA: DeoR family transcriptional regulator [Candidatus Paceibacterota bacterium]|nr:DeoR family transcriptional regulator [Candidatus Paceibacterota bacterium]
MTDAGFAGYYRAAAVSLLGAVAGTDFAGALKNVSTLEYFTRFASDVSLMNQANGDVMLGEIQAFGRALSVVMSVADGVSHDPAILSRPEPDLASIFSSGNFDTGEKSGNANPAIRQEKESGNMVEEAASEPKNDPIEKQGQESEINGILKSAIRQSAILDRIRQMGNCRMKDIQEILPNASERTLRYDLQTLVEQGLIDRVGTGGPAVFYRIRQTLPGPMPVV